MTIDTAYDYYVNIVKDFKSTQTSVEEQHLSPMPKDGMFFTALLQAHEVVNIYVKALAASAEAEFSPIPFVQVSRAENTARIMKIWQRRLYSQSPDADARLESLLHFLINEVKTTFEEDHYGSSEPSIAYQSALNGLEGVRMFLEYINRLGLGGVKVDVGAIRHGFSQFPSTALAA